MGPLLFSVANAAAAIIVANQIGRAKGRRYGWVWGFCLGWVGVLIIRFALKPKQEVALPADQRAFDRVLSERNARIEGQQS